jgi:hypothetical protein
LHWLKLRPRSLVSAYFLVEICEICYNSEEVSLCNFFEVPIMGCEEVDEKKFFLVWVKDASLVFPLRTDYLELSFVPSLEIPL